MKPQIIAISFVAVLALASLGCEYVPPVTDHQKGYREGHQAVEQMRYEHGELGAQATATGAELRGLFGPIDDTKSPEWNRGVQQGIRDAANGQ